MNLGCVPIKDNRLIHRNNKNTHARKARSSLALRHPSKVCRCRYHNLSSTPCTHILNRRHVSVEHSNMITQYIQIQTHTYKPSKKTSSFQSNLQASNVPNFMSSPQFSPVSSCSDPRITIPSFVIYASEAIKQHTYTQAHTCISPARNSLPFKAPFKGALISCS